MARVVLICFLLFVAGHHLAAASKTFGGYGEEGAAQAQQLVEGILTPMTTKEQATPEAEGETQQPSTPAVEGVTQQPYTPAVEGEASSSSPATAQEGGYGEPLNGLNEKAINDILNEHNVFRAKEHVPPLKWNTTLAKFSQDYVETLKKDCKMVHSTSPYGENLMLGSGAISWKMTVDEWSAEKKGYNYGANTCEPGKMCGHYTAVVWKDTTSVGCGRVLCDNKETMILCSYWPPGNYVDQRPY